MDKQNETTHDSIILLNHHHCWCLCVMLPHFHHLQLLGWFLCSKPYGWGLSPWASLPLQLHSQPGYSWCFLQPHSPKYPLSAICSRECISAQPSSPAPGSKLPLPGITTRMSIPCLKLSKSKMSLQTSISKGRTHLYTGTHSHHLDPSPSRSLY